MVFGGGPGQAMIFSTKNSRIILNFMALIALCAPVFAQEQGGAQDGVQDHAAEDFAPVYTITCPTALHFGMVVTCPAGGTVSVPAQGAARVTGCVAVSPGTSHAGQCRVEQPGRNEYLQVTVLGPTMLSGSAGQMPVDGFTLQSAAGQSGAEGDFLITSESRAEIKVGGRLNVAPHQANGLYSGAVTLTVMTE